MPTSSAARTLLGGVAAVAVVVLVAAPASAHVTVTPSSAVAGSHSVLRFDVGHGCEGSPTTRLVISVPDDVLEVTPTRHPFYEVSKQMTRLDEPVTGEDGEQVSEKVATVTYRARTPLPDGYRDAVELALVVPDRPGELLQFPTIQVCEQGRAAWTEVPASGQDLESLEHPAPGFVIEAADAQPAAGGGEDSDPLTWLALALGVVGTALGGAALALTRRRG